MPLFSLNDMRTPRDATRSRMRHLPNRGTFLAVTGGPRLAAAVVPTDAVRTFLDKLPASIREAAHGCVVGLLEPEILGSDLDVIEWLRDYLNAADRGPLGRANATIVVTMLVDFWAASNPYAKNDFLFDLAIKYGSAALMRVAELSPLQSGDHNDASAAWRALRASTLTNETLRRFQISSISP